MKKLTELNRIDDLEKAIIVNKRAAQLWPIFKEFIVKKMNLQPDEMKNYEESLCTYRYCFFHLLGSGRYRTVMKIAYEFLGYNWYEYSEIQQASDEFIKLIRTEKDKNQFKIPFIC